MRACAGPSCFIPPPARGASHGEDGAAAVARITRFPEMPRENPEGKLDAVLGAPGDPKVEVAKILIREGIERGAPARRGAEAEAYGAEVAREALAGREDLTRIPLPTIDPEDARDHDDAVWVDARADDGGYKAWIAIADVSHYVRPGTATRRGGARPRVLHLPARSRDPDAAARALVEPLLAPARRDPALPLRRGRARRRRAR